MALGPVILDVRTEEDWRKGHLAGAVHVPVPPPPLKYSDLCRIVAAVGAFAYTVPKTRPVAVYCNRGVRSALAAALLRAQGKAQVYDLGGASAGPLSAYLRG